MPTNLSALLLYTDDLSPALAYVLSQDYAGRWQLSAHVADELPNLTRASEVQPVRVDAGADLRTAEDGAVTTVQRLS